MKVPPSFSWTFVFVPALCYFVATRMSQAGFRLGRSYHLGTTVANRIQVPVVLEQNDDNNKDPLLSLCENTLSKIFYLSSCDDTTNHVATLQYGVQQVFSAASGVNMYTVASTWKHDAELGRGYLLWSDASQDGNIWRWEVGGGPIAIGRTLHLDRAGCRSGLYRQCSRSGTIDSATRTNGIDTGSGGISIDFYQQEHASQGNLVIAEWGEGRIVRLEEASGARTPLVIQVPDLCSDQSSTTEITSAATCRVHQPHTLLYTSTGDLLFVDSQPECEDKKVTNAVFRLKYAMHIPALSDLKQSREAHAWENVPSEASDIPEVLYTSAQSIGGIAMMHDPTLSSILLSTKSGNNVVLVEVPLGDENDDDDEEEEGKISRRSRQLVDLTHDIPSAKNPGALAVSHEGYAFVAVIDGIAVVDLVRKLVVGTVDLPVSPTSLTIGEDGFLYMTSRESLFRIGVRVKPVPIPSNKVRRKPKS